MNLQEWIKKGEPLNSFLNCDCMEFMKDMPDKYFDLCIVDPPYGIGASNDARLSGFYTINMGGKKTKVSANNYKKKEWDYAIPDKKYFEELFRISKNQIIWGGNYFIKYLKNTSCFVVWDKDNGENNNADCELAWTSFKTAVRKFKWRWNGLLQENMKEKQVRIHPTEKPIQLYRWLLQNYAKPGYKIFDSHVGSGSSIIACILEDYSYIGCELDKDYYKSAEDRIEQYKAQGRLF